jgi:SET domain
VVAVMAELAAGSASKWAPYLVCSRLSLSTPSECAELTARVSFVSQAALPRDLHVSVCWSEHQRTWLRGTSCAERLKGNAGELPCGTARAWRDVSRPMASELGLPVGSDGRHLHALATALVAAYSFTLGSEHHQGLVPFWDALNHTHPEMASVRLRHNPQRQCLEMILVRDHAAGEQVFNTYGPLGTGELVRRYGFAMDGVNHYDSAEVHWKEVFSAARRVMGVVRTEHMVTHSRALRHLFKPQRLSLGSDGVPPARLVLVLRMLCAESEALIRKLIRCIVNGRPPTQLSTVDSRAIDARTAAALLELCNIAQMRRQSVAMGDYGSAAVERHRFHLAALVRQSESRCFEALATRLNCGQSTTRVLARDAAALWRECMLASARGAVAGRRRKTLDFSSARDARRLALAGVLQSKMN